MYLQLAEGRGYTPPSVYMAERTRVSAYRRKSNYVPMHYRELSEAGSPYIFMPAHLSPTGTDLNIREDHFDNLSKNEWKGLMWQLAPFQPEVKSQQMSEGMFLSGRAERKTARAEKKAIKAEKKEVRGARRADVIKSITGSIAGVAGKIFGKGGEEHVVVEVTPEVQQAGPGGLPKWVVPVGIGVAGLGILAMVMGKKRRR